MILAETINKINDLPILQVAEKFCPDPVIKNGVNYKTKCFLPGHHDSNPSLVISPVKNIARCFVCDCTMNNISMVAQIRGLDPHKDFPIIVKEIAAGFNIEVEEDNKPQSDEQLAISKEKNELAVAMSWAANWYHNNLLVLWDRVEDILEFDIDKTIYFNQLHDYELYSLLYIRRRFQNIETVKQFKIGYAPYGYDNLLKAARKEGFKDEILKKAGLVKERSFAVFGDFFINRPVIIPIVDHRQRVVSLAARELPQMARVDGKYPKYMNGPEGLLYKKAQVAYGLNPETIKEIKAADRIIVVEGYMDKVKLFNIGIKNVVAKCGTAFTDEQVEILRAFSKNFTIIGDGDDAGIKANGRDGKKLTLARCDVAILPLPTDGGKTDPDSFFFSKEQFNEYRKQNEVDYIIDLCAVERLNATSNSAEQIKIINEVAELLFYKPKEDRDFYIKRIVKETNTTTDQLRGAIQAFAISKKSEDLNVKKKRPGGSDIKTDQSPENKKKHSFYYIKKNKKGQFEGIDIDELELLNLLKDYEMCWGKNNEKTLGFFVYQLDETSDDFFYVHLRHGRIKKVNSKYIMKTFLNFVRALKPYEYSFYDENGKERKQVITSDMIEKQVLKRRAWFKDDLINLLHPDTPIEIIEDSMSNHYTFYNNCYVVSSKPTADNPKGYTVMDYESMKKYIWEDNIIDRDFVDSDNIAPGYLEKFMHDISGNYWNLKENKPDMNDPERLRAFKILAGYLQHNYLNRKLKSVILTDSRMGEGNMGRGGKTFFVDMIGEFLMNRSAESKTYVNIDGKELQRDNKHKYEDLDRNTKLFQYNDPKHINMEDLFVGIEKGWNVDQKREKAYRVKAKCIITTNKPIERDDESSKDRTCVLEVVSCFTANNGPDRKYGIWFGRDFKKADWQAFDIYAQKCLVEYFANNCELIEPVPINLHRRELITFAEHHIGVDSIVYWLDSKILSGGIAIGQEYDVVELREKFTSECSDVNKEDKRLVKNFTKVVNYYLTKENIQFRNWRANGRPKLQVNSISDKVTKEVLQLETKTEQEETFPVQDQTLPF